MGCDLKNESCTPPKLSLFSLPSQPPEPLGLLTPPLQAPASVPFQWEEVPGKPRECAAVSPRPKAARCLELPPRLLATEVKVNDMAVSPTTVLEGPQVGRSLSFSFSFRKGPFRSLAPTAQGSSSSIRREAKEGQSGSCRWSTSDKENRDVGGSLDLSSFLFGESVNDNGGGCTRGGCGSETKVKMTKMRRRGSLLCLSPRSQLLVSAYTKI